MHQDAAGALPPAHPSGRVASLVDWAEVSAPRNVFAFAPRGMALVKARLAAKARPPRVQVPDDDDSDQEAAVVLDEPSGAGDDGGDAAWAQTGAKYYRAVFSSGDGACVLRLLLLRPAGLTPRSSWACRSQHTFKC